MTGTVAAAAAPRDALRPSTAAGVLDGLLDGMQGYLDADVLIAFEWRDDRTVVVRAVVPPLPTVVPGDTLTLDRARVCAAGGVLLGAAAPRHLVSSALQCALPDRATAAWVITGAATGDDVPPAGGVLAVWCGPRAPAPAFGDGRALARLRDGIARALRAERDARAADDHAIRFDAIMAAVPQGVVFVDDYAGVGLANAAAAALLGVREGLVAPAEIAGRMRALRARVTGSPTLEAEIAALATPGGARVDGWVWNVDGTADGAEPRTLRVTTALVASDASRGRIWTFDDITRETATAREMRTLFAAMRDVVIVFDRDGTYRRIVPTAPDLRRKPSPALLGRRLHDVFPREQADRSVAAIRRALDEGGPVDLEYVLDLPDGRAWFAGTASPLGDGTVLWVARDITERRAAEAERARLLAILEATPDVVSLATPDGRVVYVNQAVRRLLDVPAGAPLTGAEFAAAHPPAVAARLRAEAIPAAVRDGHWRGESVLVAADGRHVPVSQVIQAHYGADGAVEYLSTIMRDVSAEQQAEAALRASEARFRGAMAASPDACFLLETVRGADGVVTDFVFVEANAATGVLYGMPAEDLAGHGVCELFPLFRDSAVMRHYVGAVDTGAPYEGEYQTRDPRARAAWLALQAVPFSGADGSVIGLAVTARDITAQKRAAEDRRLLHEVTAALGMAPDVEGALRGALGAMCEATATPYGEVWIPAATLAGPALGDVGTAGAAPRAPTQLIRGPAWYAPDDDHLAAFDRASRAWTFGFGEGIPGAAAVARAPVWIGDLSAACANFPRATLARDAGLRGGFAVSLVDDDVVVAVVAFYVRQEDTLDTAARDRLAWVGAQVGAVVRRRQAEAALASERAFLTSVLDSLSENVTVCSPEGRLVLFNRATCETHGVPADGSLLPERWSDRYSVFGPDGVRPLATAELPHVRALATRAAVDGVEFVVDVPGRTRRTLVANARPILGPGGAFLGSVCAARDVTAERAAAAALEREREFLRAVLESVEDGVVACDAEGRLTLFNGASRRFHGLAEDASLAPERWAEHYRLYHADAATPMGVSDVPLVRALRDGTVNGVEIVIAAHGRPPRHVTCSGRRFTDDAGRGLGAVVTMHDVTERIQAERRKSEFVTTVSHELRTPLTSIRGSLGLLEAGIAGALPAKAGSLVGIAKSNTERLIRLVTDVLDLDKIEAGKLEYAMTAQDPADLVGAAADGVVGMAAGARIEVVTQVDARAVVVGDRDRLLQVLTNLLSNAIKFSPPDSAVVVSARDHTDGAGRHAVRFAVEDFGPGIPPDKLDLLFQKFRQLGHTESTRRGGTGLGLAISKAIVEQHGGSVGVASEPGRRTVFWCDLPAHPPVPVAV